MFNKNILILILGISFVFLEVFLKASNIAFLNQLNLIVYLAILLMLTGESVKGVIFLLISSIIIEGLTFQIIGLTSFMLFSIIILLLMINKYTKFFADKSALFLGSIIIITYQVAIWFLIHIFVPEHSLAIFSILIAIIIYSGLLYLFDSSDNNVYTRS